jgi:NAD(P)-dependent dehydrogenase (short-subunit alcohol dehydrogenase family)
MSMHPAITPGRAAVITGAASGIGLAAAQRFAALGMKLCLADVNAAGLEAAAATMPDAEVVTVPSDVSRLDQVQALHQRARDAFGEVAVLMNNAGREGGGALSAPTARWHEILDTNLWGVIHGVQVFTPDMVAQGTPCAVINTGSKQGITCPPGDTAYNVSKAGIKVVTEALAHDLRSTPGCQVSAHLLIPGFTFTGFTRVRVSEKPQAAWTAEQVVDFMLEGMGRGQFYILCPDNDVTREMDCKRIAWAAADITEDRPALSRWHPDYKEAFAAFMRE